MKSGRKLSLVLAAALIICPLSGSGLLAGQGVWTGNGLPGGDVVALAIDLNDPSILYAGTPAGLFKSANGGESWAATGFTASVLSIAVDRLLSDRVYVGSSELGVFRSADGGALWIRAGTELQGRSITALAIDPTDGDRLYAGSSLGRLFRSVDGGESWTESSLEPPPGASPILSIAIDPSNRRTIYVGTYTAVFKTVDAGETWRTLGVGGPVLAIDPRTPRIVYAGGSSGIWRSADGGESWTNPAADSPSPVIRQIGGIVTALVVDPVRTSTLYAGSANFFARIGISAVGVSITRDRGATWRLFNDGDPRMASSLVRALVIDRTGRQLHAATFGGGVFDYEIAPSFSAVLPAAASLHGVPPAFFHSDVAVFNESAGRPVEVTATYRCTSGACGPSRSFSIPPRQLVLFEDIAGNVFGAPESSGAIEFSSTEPIVVTSRLYTPERSAPTLGMFVPGLGPEKAFAPSMLTNLSHSADPSVGFRTNLGLFNPTNQGKTVFFNCRDSSGSYLGTTSRQAGPHQLVQVNDVDLFRELAVARDVPDFYCAVVGVSPPVYAWASVIDNQSNDSSFVYPLDPFYPETSNVTLPAAASIHGASGTFFLSDVTVRNGELRVVEVTARYRCFLGACGDTERIFTLAPSEVRLFADAVGGLFGSPETGGTVEFRAQGSISVASRLYTGGPTVGTVGMFVPGLGPLESSPSRVLPLLSPSTDRSRGSRVNVGVYNPGDVPQTVTVRLYSAIGVLLGSLSRALGGRQGFQVNDVFGELGIAIDADAAYCLVEGDGARPIFAYAAVIDNQSQDPIFVTGQDDPERPPIE